MGMGPLPGKAGMGIKHYRAWPGSCRGEPLPGKAGMGMGPLPGKAGMGIKHYRAWPGLCRSNWA